LVLHCVRHVPHVLLLLLSQQHCRHLRITYHTCSLKQQVGTVVVSPVHAAAHPSTEAWLEQYYQIREIKIGDLQADRQSASRRPHY
jgi:hypothetical protein